MIKPVKCGKFIVDLQNNVLLDNDIVIPIDEMLAKTPLKQIKDLLHAKKDIEVMKDANSNIT